MATDGVKYDVIVERLLLISQSTYRIRTTPKMLCGVYTLCLPMSY